MKRDRLTPSLWLGGVESATAELPRGQGALPFPPEDRICHGCCEGPAMYDDPDVLCWNCRRMVRDSAQDAADEARGAL